MSARSKLHRSAFVIGHARLTTRAQLLGVSKDYTHKSQLFCIQNTLVVTDQ